MSEKRIDDNTIEITTTIVSTIKKDKLLAMKTQIDEKYEVILASIQEKLDLFDTVVIDPKKI